MKILISLPFALFLTSVAVNLPAFADDALDIQNSEETPTAKATVDCDIWLISTRRLPCVRNSCDPPDEPTLYRRLGCRWIPATLTAFYETANPTQITCFYVHGNRTSPDEARERGMEIYRRLACTATPLRFVIWSWPSTEMHGRIRDARAKAARADAEAFYLANTLGDLPDNSTVSLIGYSFGARVVTGSLHMLAGGQFCGNSLPTERLPAFRPRAILIAGAVCDGWIRPGGAQGLATSKIDHMYSTFNPRDPALKRFYVTSKSSNPKALGYRGLAENCLGANACLVTQQDVSAWVGWSHRFDRHVASKPLMNRVRKYALWYPVR